MWIDPALTGPRIRHDESKPGLLEQRLNQTDYANELHTLFAVQKLDEDTARAIIDAVFQAESPRGSWLGHIGKDPLPGQGGLFRASKADPAFQEFRIRGTLANVRIVESGQELPLSNEQKNKIANGLNSWHSVDAPTWSDVSQMIGVPRNHLRGTAAAGIDGEPSVRPPINITDRAIRRSKIRPLVIWWEQASPEEQSLMTEIIVGDRAPNDSSSEFLSVGDALVNFSEDDLSKLETLKLPAGRAAYSRESLRSLTDRMKETGEDLHESRKAVFGVGDSWAPPTDPINAPLGNPSVNRITKEVGRWLGRVEEKWGVPDRIVIEHVRSSFISVAQAKDFERANERRRKVYDATRNRMAEEGIGDVETIRREQVLRFISVQRQNCKCLYCGETINYHSAQLDHIVPRKGIGGRSTQDNLVAVCATCNRGKSNTPFRIWAERTTRPGVSVKEASDRVDHWVMPVGWGASTELRTLRKAVKARLIRTEADEPIDDRAMESVAWMARELAGRIRGHFAQITTGHENPPNVWVFRGRVTAEARRAAGVDKNFEMIGGYGKQRFDRRHHIVDAAIVALMQPRVAQVLSERLALRDEAQLLNVHRDWKNHHGSTPDLRVTYNRWLNNMNEAVRLLQDAIDSDTLVVRNLLRLTKNIGRLHEESIRKLERHRVGDALPAKLIDRAATPALVYALTQHPDYDTKLGLPESPRRGIRLHGTHLANHNEIEFFKTNSAALATQGGYVELGSTVHHARIYKYKKGKTFRYGMIRVFGADVSRMKGDIFSHPLRQGDISIRTANDGVRQALINGTAEYLGWLVPGDEIYLPNAALRASNASEFATEFPSVERWEVLSFESPMRMGLQPLLLSREDVPEGLAKAVTEVFKRGWLANVNKLFAMPGIRIIRRDALGHEREKSAANLPTSWAPQQE